MSKFNVKEKTNMLYSAIYQSPLGKIVLLSDEKALLGLWFNNQKNYGAHYDLAAAKKSKSRPIRLAINWL
ncbi:hypothetical protein [Bombilactobacillus thymidiniphilus]|uniref:Methylguanine DNA methyltransferase ribonuclease-like domain-containing protein n=1 Tax=Bombilactobacillus thymidiniphilus TaxID=2923363 RepID=A0ABY4PDL2_9LACO|nr:hypothetical protein [Bombilactobacillus thymidiniphilus]UQS83586.1 hypothetical protein MOO47_07425 [Bombilactobacillus thymidiniphilus]